MKTIKVFIPYSRSDEKNKQTLMDEIENITNPHYSFVFMTDKDVPTGDDWETKIREYIENADTALIMLTPNFLDSDRCLAEVELSMERFEKEGKPRLVPVQVEPCAWKRVFKKLAVHQAIPFGRSIFPKASSSSDAPKEEIAANWKEVAEKIHDLGWQLSDHPVEISPISEQDSKALKKVVTSGHFAPILGATCHIASERREEAFSSLRDHLGWIYEQTGDGELWEHVYSIVLSKLKRDILGGVALQVRNPPLDWWPRLVAFQVLLAKVSVQACKLFGLGMCQQAKGIDDLAKYYVDLENLSTSEDSLPSSTVFRRDLAHLVNKAADLHSRTEHFPNIRSELGMNGIQVQLAILLSEIFSDVDPEVEDFPAGILPTSHRSRGDGTYLRLSDLQWLADLLWHTLRFQVPLYPSSEDLAFQLAVSADEILPPKRETVGAVASFVQKKEKYLPSLIASWLQRCHQSGLDERPIEKGFYKAIVRGLTYSSTTTARRKKPKETAGGSFLSATDRFRKRLSLVINTNFDMELEDAFGESAYHIIIPINVHFRRGAQESSEPDWLINIANPDSGKSWSLLGDSWSRAVSAEKNRLSLLQKYLQGPVIVKLHGSPLQGLPEFKAIDGSASSYLSNTKLTHVTHRLVFSEYDLLHQIIEGGVLPGGLRELLPREKLCFMGFRFSDFYHRLQLYDHARFSRVRGGQDEDGEDEPSTRGVLLVDVSRGPVYSAVANQAGARFIPASLQEVSRVIHEALDEAEKETSHG